MSLIRKMYNTTFMTMHLHAHALRHDFILNDPIISYIKTNAAQKCYPILRLSVKIDRVFVYTERPGKGKLNTC